MYDEAQVKRHSQYSKSELTFERFTFLCLNSLIQLFLLTLMGLKIQ